MRKNRRLSPGVPEDNLLVAAEVFLVDQAHQSGHPLPRIDWIEENPFGPCHHFDRLKTLGCGDPIAFPDIVIKDQQVIWVGPPAEFKEFC